MSVRDDREQAYWEHWRAGLRDNPRDALPGFLDALEAVDARHQADDAGHIRTVPDSTPTDDEIAAWIEAHPREFAAWAANQARVSGGTVTAAPRRRTARKDGAT